MIRTEQSEFRQSVLLDPTDEEIKDKGTRTAYEVIFRDDTPFITIQNRMTLQSTTVHYLDLPEVTRELHEAAGILRFWDEQKRIKT